MTGTVGKTNGMHVWRCQCGKTGQERLERLAWRALNLHVECQHPLAARGLRAAHIYLDRKAAA